MRKLKASEIECRVQTVKDTGVSLLLYKTARVDRAILDEEYGCMNWQNDFKIIDGKMYGYVSVWDKEKQQWITKCDCGTESNLDKEKGEASDCFKRAGFKWGIGIELYSAPSIWVNGNGNDLKFKKYKVDSIGYADNGDINQLKIIDDKKNVVFELGKYTAPPKAKPKKETVSDKDMEFYKEVALLEDVEDLKKFYELTKEQADDRKAYHALVMNRLKEIKKGG